MSALTLEDRLEAIAHRRIKLSGDPDDPREVSPHKPNLAVWAGFKDGEGGAVVTLMLDALWGQPSRFVTLTPGDARTLAALLSATADAVDAAVASAEPAPPTARIRAVVEGSAAKIPSA